MRLVPSIVKTAAACLSRQLSKEYSFWECLPRTSRSSRRVCSARSPQPNGWSLSNCSPRFRPTDFTLATRRIRVLAFSDDRARSTHVQDADILFFLSLFSIILVVLQNEILFVKGKDHGVQQSRSRDWRERWDGKSDCSRKRRDPIAWMLSPNRKTSMKISSITRKPTRASIPG